MCAVTPHAIARPHGTPRPNAARAHIRASTKSGPAVSGHPRPTGDRPKRAHIIAHSGEKASAVQKANPDAPPAGKTRKPSVCSYSKGMVQPTHATKRTCPMFLADEAAKEAAGTASTGDAGPSSSQ